MECGFGLSRSERLRGDKTISRLFTEGHSGFVFPFRYFYIFGEADGDAPAAMLVSVPKKLFKRAVKRNLLKRRTREAYRLEKSAVTGCRTGVKLYIAFVYASKEAAGFEKVRGGIKRILSAVAKECPADV